MALRPRTSGSRGSSGGWTATVAAPVGSDSTWAVERVTLSVGTSLNDATRNAWREVRALISDTGLRRVIDQELR